VVAAVEARGGGTDLWWPLWRLMVVLAGGGDAGGEMAVALGGGLSLFSPLLLYIFFLFFLCFSFGLQLLPSSVMLFPSSVMLLPSSFLLLLPPSVFIGRNRGGDPYYPCQRGRVVGAATVQPPQNHPRAPESPSGCIPSSSTKWQASREFYRRLFELF